jgi:hypothetical protein
MENAFQFFEQWMWVLCYEVLDALFKALTPREGFYFIPRNNRYDYESIQQDATI